MAKNSYLRFLFLASLISIFACLFRIFYFNKIEYIYLYFNLGLAWIPVFISHVLQTIVRRKQFGALMILGFLWLIFFPNTIYLVTDFVHLKSDRFIIFIYDVFMFTTFAVNGLLLGFFSLYVLENLALKKINPYIFSSLILTAGSCGVAIGRFLRWNSWDIFLSPSRVIIESAMFLTSTFGMIFTLFMIFCSVLLYQLLRPMIREAIKL